MLVLVMRNRMDNAKEWADFICIMRNLRWYRSENLLWKKDK